MNIAALIVAAGMSSHMSDFKPMMNIGSISAAQRIIATFHQAGVTKIVMVTGFNATMLERHLSGNGIIFLRNEQYETTQMFDSVKIGLEYLKDKCDRVLFTPVDVPLFTAHTVSKLMTPAAPLILPRCQGKGGHPVAISAELVPELLEDTGEMGLRGAMSRCSVELTFVDVEDSGTLKDADTPGDFTSLLEYHNAHLVRPEISVALAREVIFLDSKTATLLALVDETNSVKTACQRMQISYTSAWSLIRTLESQLSYPLLLRSQGGATGGTSVLSDRGKQLLKKFLDYQTELRNYAKLLYEKCFSDEFDVN